MGPVRDRPSRAPARAMPSTPPRRAEHLFRLNMLPRLAPLLLTSAEGLLSVTILTCPDFHQPFVLTETSRHSQPVMPSHAGVICMLAANRRPCRQVGLPNLSDVSHSGNSGGVSQRNDDVARRQGWSFLGSSSTVKLPASFLLVASGPITTAQSATVPVVSFPRAIIRAA